MAAAPTDSPLVDIVPTRAFFRPGEPVVLRITARAGHRAEVTILHLAETAATLSAELKDGGAELTWHAPETAPRGYGVTLCLLDASGNELATAATAFDVLERWTQAPRYGFLSEFGPGRADADQAMDWLLAYHVNGLQFYDWQYRHETLLPPAEPYTDLLGRQLSLEVVNALIDAAHARNIAAMPYTAIYGASVAFYEQHPEWALFQRPGVPYNFGGNFLIIMDPSRGSPWAAHLLSEYTRTLDETRFDGIHIDQYGAPKIGRNASNERVDLARVFPEFIDDTAALVREKRGGAGATIFNAVGNWPVDTVAPAAQDVVYIEVWEPYRYFVDLHRLVVEAQQLGGGKPVILAAYIDPRREHNVRLANAVIFASGGYHLELGEPGAMLADPYFPKFGLMDTAFQAVVRRYYDFLVRYQELLAFGSAGSAARAEALTIDGVETAGRRSRDRVMVILREGQAVEAFNLVNLLGLHTGQWDVMQPDGPTPLTDVEVQIRTERPVMRAWWASPDGAQTNPQPIPFTTGGDAEGTFIRFRLPHLEYWTMVVLEYA